MENGYASSIQHRMHKIIRTVYFDGTAFVHTGDVLYIGSIQPFSEAVYSVSICYIISNVTKWLKALYFTTANART